MITIERISIPSPHIYMYIYHTCMCAQSLQSCPTLCNLMNLSHHALLSMEFSRQGYWSGPPLPPPGDLLNPEI